MTTGVDERVVGILEEVWSAIGALGRDLAPAEWDMPSECPGWCVRDLVAHMIGTERSLLGDPPPDPVVDAPDHVRNAVGVGNEAWVAPRRSVPAGEVLDEFTAVTAARLAQLRSWPAARFEEIGPSPVGQVPYREYMAVRVMDCWVHEQDMRVATGRPGHAEGPAAQLALARLVAALPFVVGKQAGAPEGARVRFELRGPVLGPRVVAVHDGRAAVDDDSGGEPTAVIELGDEAFWRLTCGRVGGSAALGAGLVSVTGDESLAHRVLDAMAFMV